MSLRDMQVLTVGHCAPPVTGENICRDRLEKALAGLGAVVSSYGRTHLAPWLKATQKIVIVNGESRLGTLYDQIFCVFQVLRGRAVCFYFHNRSWERYMLFGRMLQAIAKPGQVQALVLTAAIRERLVSGGIAAVVLNNTAGLDFERLPAAAASRRLLWMGRPDVAKGFDVALEAFRVLHRVDSIWRFDVYGSTGEEFASLPNVFFHGFVSGASKVAAFEKGGIFILPSRYVNETQPLAIIEALAAGLPVVASDIGGIPQMLRSAAGNAGFVIRDRTPQVYAEAVRSCFEDYGRYSANARRIYRSSFSHEEFLRNVEMVFRRGDVDVT